jgi:hypothetical protein
MDKLDTHSMVGSWQVNVVPDPTTGVPPTVNFSVMTEDGMIINVNEKGLAAVGQWERLADSEVATTFRGSEANDGQSVRYRVMSTVALGADGLSFSGPFSTDIHDTDGTLLASVSGSVQATRMQVEHLE